MRNTTLFQNVDQAAYFVSALDLGWFITSTQYAEEGFKNDSVTLLRPTRRGCEVLVITEVEHESSSPPFEVSYISYVCPQGVMMTNDGRKTLWKRGYLSEVSLQFLVTNIENLI